MTKSAPLLSSIVRYSLRLVGAKKAVVQLGAVRHELKEVYHDAGRAAVLVQIGVGVAVRVDQNLKMVPFALWVVM